MGTWSEKRESWRWDQLTGLLLFSRQPRCAVIHNSVRSRAPAREAKVVGEGCFLTAVSTLELQGWTGRGMGRAPPPPAQGGCKWAGGQGHLGASQAQESQGWLAARGFILPKGKIPSGGGLLARAWASGRLFCSPVQGPRVHLQSLSVPQVGPPELRLA